VLAQGKGKGTISESGLGFRSFASAARPTSRDRCVPETVRRCSRGANFLHDKWLKDRSQVEDSLRSRRSPTSRKLFKGALGSHGKLVNQGETDFQGRKPSRSRTRRTGASSTSRRPEPRIRSAPSKAARPRTRSRSTTGTTPFRSAHRKAPSTSASSAADARPVRSRLPDARGACSRLRREFRRQPTAKRGRPAYRSTTTRNLPQRAQVPCTSPAPSRTPQEASPSTSCSEQSQRRAPWRRTRLGPTSPASATPRICERAPTSGVGSPAPRQRSYCTTSGSKAPQTKQPFAAFAQFMSINALISDAFKGHGKLTNLGERHVQGAEGGRDQGLEGREHLLRRGDGQAVPRRCQRRRLDQLHRLEQTGVGHRAKGAVNIGSLGG